MKVLMIGLGGIGQRHMRNLRALLPNQVEFLAYRVRGLTHIVTPKLEADLHRNVEQEYGIRVYSDLDSALAEKPDLAFVCNPSNLHIATATECLNAGCDVFIEKPLADSFQGVEQLISIADRGKKIAMVGYQLRFHPCLNKLASVVASGDLGHILSVRATVGENLPSWHPYEDYRQMYAARADLGGGVVLSQIHEFDYLYFLFGLPTTIYAIGGHWSHLEINVEDTASILMKASVEGRPLPIHLHQDYLQTPPSRQCEVIGDRGRVVIDFLAATVTVIHSGTKLPTAYSFPRFERNQLFLDEVRHFLQCVHERKPPLVDLRAGRASLQMALAAKHSMAAGVPVELGCEGGGYV